MSDEIPGLGSNLERAPLRSQAKAVLMFLEAAQEALEHAKTAAENMDAEQARPHVGKIRRPSQLLMASRHGVQQTIAAWVSLADQLPALYSPVAASQVPDGPGVGPVLKSPARACTACGGSRRTWDSALGRKAACGRCRATGVEP